MPHNIPEKDQLQCDACYRIKHASQIENYLGDLSADVDIEPSFLAISINYCLKSKACLKKAEKMAEEFRRWIESRHKESPFRFGKS